MSNLQGPLLMIGAMAGFAIEDALIKILARSVPPGQIAIVIGVLGTLAFALVLRRQGLRLFVPEGLRGAALARTLTEVGAVICMTLGLALVPISIVAAILQAMPLLVTMAAALFLGEKVGWRRWSAVLVGLVGVLMIVQPGAEEFDLNALLPLGAVVLLSARDIVTRKVPRAITSLQLAGWGFVASVMGGLLMLALRGEGLVVPDTGATILLVLCAGFGVLAYAALVYATRVGTLVQTIPFRYSRLIFALIIGVLVFDERPDTLMLLGSALVVTAGFYTMIREMRLKRL